MRVGIKWLAILCGLMLVGTPATPRVDPPFHTDTHNMRAQNATVRRVNAPYNVPGHEGAVFWFGQVTPSENYADVRVGYWDDLLFVHLGIMDRLLWYDRSPATNDLTAWDSATLYLSTEGNTGGNSSTHTYRFDAQLVWWGDRAAYQAAYQGDGSAWVLTTTLPFTTTSFWNGNRPNDDVDDRGWSLIYHIPFASLGLDAPPASGATWGLALALHDRDSEGGPALGDQVWPETMLAEQPATWGQLGFGAWPTYEPPLAVPGGTLTIRQGLDGVSVADADVGGSSNCGQLTGPDYFPSWGTLNYAGKEFLNIQNLGIISEWPCFSKYYVTFPLDELPPGQVILSSTLTLYQFGNAGQGYNPGPQPSFIQVLTIDQDWAESEVTWNNAPLAVENVSASWVNPLDEPPGWPGIAREWDVSHAVSAAYRAGTPVRLALYSPDWDFHSGKYFYTSDVGVSGEGRPTLAITWGHPSPQVTKHADKTGADYGELVTYVLRFRGTGDPLMLTDTLPSAVGWTNVVSVAGTEISPVYDLSQHQLTWGDAPALGTQVLITYTVSINTLMRELLVNMGELVDQAGHAHSATFMVIANPIRFYLPLLLKS